MPNFAEQITATRDRITRMLEKASEPSGWERIRSGLSGAFGTGEFTEELEKRTGPEADIQRQGTILELLRGMKSDEMADERMDLDRRRFGLEEEKVETDRRRTLLAAAEKEAEARAKAGDKRAEAYKNTVNLYKDMLNPNDFLDWHSDFAATAAYAQDDTPEAIMALGNEIARNYGPKAGSAGFAGTGIDASAWNIVLDYNRKARSGEPITEDDEDRYAAALAELEKVETFTDPINGPRTMQTQVPGRFPRPGTPPAAQTAQAAPQVAVGAPLAGAKPPGINDAARESMVPTSLAIIDQVRKEIFDADGGVNTSLLAQMAGNVVGTRGRTLRSQMEEALANLVYLKSGAQAGPNEVASAARQYLPSPLDNAATAKDKLDRLQAFFDQVQSTRGGAQTQPVVTPQDGPVRVTTKEERDALAPGTRYIGPDGKEATR